MRRIIKTRLAAAIARQPSHISNLSEQSFVIILGRGLISRKLIFVDTEHACCAATITPNFSPYAEVDQA